MFKRRKIDLKITSRIILRSVASSYKKISQISQSVAYLDFAVFDWFYYKGKDDAYYNISRFDKNYLNPILIGFYSDSMKKPMVLLERI